MPLRKTNCSRCRVDFGQPYSDFNVTTDRDNILALYFNEGFPEASFSATADEFVECGSARSGWAERDFLTGKWKKGQKEGKSKTEIEQAEAVRLVYHIRKAHKRACGEF